MFPECAASPHRKQGTPEFTSWSSACPIAEHGLRCGHRPPTALALDFARILDYFEHSPFEYLALEAHGQALLLQRPPPPPTTTLTAPSVGTVVVSAGATALPRPGDRVARGQALFALRRFKTLIEVRSPHDGELAAIDVAPGQFAEFGQALAHILPR